MDQKTFQKIKDKVRALSENANDPQHDFSHFQRVVDNANKIVNYLKLESQVDMLILQTCCLVHDCHVFFIRPSIYTHFFEITCLKKTLPKFFEEFDIQAYDKNIIFQAVYNHPYSFTYKKLNRKKDIYSRILQDADTIDYLSDKRLESLKNAKNFLHYKIASLFAKQFVMLNRKRIRNVLNFPILEKYFYV